MEGLRPHPSEQTSRRRHDPKHGYEDRERARRGKERKGGQQQSVRRVTGIGTPLGALGRGPVSRPQEKNEEFIQSWLQQTQARHSHPPATDRENQQPRLADRSRSRAHASRHGKRSRSRSAPPRPSPESTAQVEYRFEKRARHRTRDDKYEYKARAGNKPTSDEEVRALGKKDATRRGRPKCKDKHIVGGPRHPRVSQPDAGSTPQTRQKPSESGTGHMVLRGKVALICNESRISR